MSFTVFLSRSFILLYFVFLFSGASMFIFAELRRAAEQMKEKEKEKEKDKMKDFSSLSPYFSPISVIFLLYRPAAPGLSSSCVTSFVSPMVPHSSVALGIKAA